jgi:threonine synthase
MIRFRSTRGGAAGASFGAAVLQGLAPDGGLYVPESWPRIEGASAKEAGLPALASRLIAPFLEGDALAPSLPEIAREAFSFAAPLVRLDTAGALSVLELFHGPTAAFKDFGARFLAACLARQRAAASRPLSVLVATSGDTGGAVAAAFHGLPGIHVAVLFPKGLVSPTQEQQLSCWGGNVRALAVRGTFDDCQRLVKEAFLDLVLQEHLDLSSANSINLGRLLPQVVYFAAASLEVARRTGERASFVVPSGNLGNAVACLWARQLGLPVGEVVLAHNANRTVPDYLESGDWRPRRSIATLASAMDVGNPSNMERLRDLFPGLTELRAAVTACSVDDEAIRARIRAGFAAHGQVFCPHTASAAEAYARLEPRRRTRQPWVLVSTAHPAKFPEVIEPLIGRAVAVPETLAKLFAKPKLCTEIDAELAALRDVLLPSEATWKS